MFLDATFLPKEPFILTKMMHTQGKKCDCHHYRVQKWMRLGSSSGNLPKVKGTVPEHYKSALNSPSYSTL